MSKTILQRSAIVSGLVSQQELDQALAELRAETGAENISDERLGDKLVAKGKLNTWQVQQLKNGRTKFTLGSYHVIDSIGKGGMGEVYKAEHTMMGRIVAVKVLPLSRSTPDAIASFHREIRTIGQLDHSHLVRAYDAGQDKDRHFLVTEYVPGTDLRKLLRAGGPLTMAQAASIIGQAALGLEYAHSRGLIHRDIKPANLLVTPEGHVKVLDLGLAGYFNDAEQNDQFGGKVVGTADYLAPEVIMNPAVPDKRSDIYALGCTLYYAVTGKVPFAGGGMKEKARAHCQLAPLDPRRLNPELTDEFVDVIADMMAKRPEDRIQSAAEVWERLRPWMAPGASTTAMPAAAAAPFPVPVRNPAPSPVGDTEPHFLVQPNADPIGESSTSQVSLGTHGGVPVDETLPPFRSRSNVFSRQADHAAAQARMLMLIGVIAVVGVLSAVAISMLYAMLTK